MDDVDLMCMLCGGDVDDVDLMCMLCGGDVDDVEFMCMLCGGNVDGSTMWSFHMSTSTHWTNSSGTLFPVLFLTDQHNASQNLIATTERL